MCVLTELREHSRQCVLLRKQTLFPNVRIKTRYLVLLNSSETGPHKFLYDISFSVFELSFKFSAK